MIGSQRPWLIDKSALVRLRESIDAEAWLERIDRGLVRITTLTILEMAYSARSASDLTTGLGRPPIASMPVEYMTPPIEDRSVQILVLLAERGQHRAPSISDVLIAAAAELSGLTLLHLDKDFELIAAVSGQPVERLAVAS